jgi:dolichol kinase
MLSTKKKEKYSAGGLKSELFRKSIHLLIALCPLMAAMSLRFTLGILAAGVCVYVWMEGRRLAGRPVPLVSSAVNLAARPRDAGRFVLGPVTLGSGALLSLALYDSRSAAMGIYALAFGDSCASIAGKLWGRSRPAFLRGKSIEGAMACFAAVFATGWVFYRDPRPAALTAVTAALAELATPEDWDNITIPLAAGAIASLCA